ncbi:MAG: hypothetical protein RBU29_09745, partial [bacterium]|nr:hypothetical protein [bacterium]
MQNGSRWCFALFLLGISIDALQAEPNPNITIGVFGQEIAHDLSAAGMPEGPLTTLWLDENGQLWLGGAVGVGCWRDGAWQPVAGLPAAPVRAIQGRPGTVFIAYAHEIWQVQPSGASPRVQGFAGTIHALAVTESALYASTSLGVFSEREGHLELDTALQALMGDGNLPLTIACGHQGELAVGGEMGLFTQSPGGAWQAHDPASADGKSWAVRQVCGVGYDSAGNLWFCSAQGVGVRSSEWRLYAGPDGLPYAEFTSLTVAPDDTVWFATRLGAIHFDGQEWAYRQGRRWLPHDAVAAIAVNARGDAWFATAGGLGQIERRPMTLAEKAAFYEDEMERYIKRTAFGYVSEVALAKPGDKSTVVQSDSDNDGLWTSMYGAGECFAYAATKDPQAKRRAQQAFEALRFLSVAPAQGEVEQQPGFVARTVVPTTEPDPNLRESYTVEGMKRRRQHEDGQWKVYFPRWPKTQDGAYWYKTDTSSDELDGHYFFYPI